MWIALNAIPYITDAEINNKQRLHKPIFLNNLWKKNNKITNISLVPCLKMECKSTCFGLNVLNKTYPLGLTVKYGKSQT